WVVQDPESADLTRWPGVPVPDGVRDGHVDQRGQHRPYRSQRGCKPQPATPGATSAARAISAWATAATRAVRAASVTRAAFATRLLAVSPLPVSHVFPEASVAILAVASPAVVRPFARRLRVFRPLFCRPLFCRPLFCRPVDRPLVARLAVFVAVG